METQFGGGSYVCSVCGKTVFGSVICSCQKEVKKDVDNPTIIKSERYTGYVIKFLIDNGWRTDDILEGYIVIGDLYTHFYKEGNIAIDVDNNEVVFLNGIGDFASFPINSLTVYTLLGYMIQHHILSMDYKMVG